MNSLYVRAPVGRVHRRLRPVGQVARPDLPETFAGFRGGGDSGQLQVVGAHAGATSSIPASGAGWRSDRESAVASLGSELRLPVPADPRPTYSPILAPRRDYTRLIHSLPTRFIQMLDTPLRSKAKDQADDGFGKRTQNGTKSAMLEPNVPFWKIKSLLKQKLGL
jgi:hypothetical protein